jgi:hypothetical protein
MRGNLARSCCVSGSVSLGFRTASPCRRRPAAGDVRLTEVELQRAAAAADRDRDGHPELTDAVKEWARARNAQNKIYLVIRVNEIYLEDVSNRRMQESTMTTRAARPGSR